MKNILNRRRIHLFEWEDLSWFPDIIRSGGLDFLRYFLIHSGLYKPTIPLLHKALTDTGETHLIDLCSGGGGYIEQVYGRLNEMEKDRFSIQLTDKFPNLPAYQLIKERTKGKIDYVDHPVNVFAVPKDLKGFRVMYSAIHHFRPKEVRAIIADAVALKQPIAIFDGLEYKPLAMLGLIIIHPILFFLLTPFFKPFKLSRIVFTYIIPLIPLYTIWDGLVSIIRFYYPEELKEIANSIQDSHYTWQYGQTKNALGMKASYLIGYPGTING